MGDDTAVVSLQNGVDNEERLAAVLGDDRVVGGAAYIFATIAAPGVIDHTGGPASVVVGEWRGGASQRVTSLVEAFRAADVTADDSSNIRAVLWSKFAFICAQAGVTAAVRLPIGEIRSQPAGRELFRNLAAEVCAVAAAEGVELPADLPDRTLGFADALEPGGGSSLYHDLVHGRRMELDTLLGEVIRRGELEALTCARAGLCTACCSRGPHARSDPTRSVDRAELTRLSPGQTHPTGGRQPPAGAHKVEGERWVGPRRYRVDGVPHRARTVEAHVDRVPETPAGDGVPKDVRRDQVGTRGPSLPGAVVVIRWWAGFASLGAGLIHLAWSLEAMTSGPLPVPRLFAATNAAVIGLWLLTRTTGLPVGPEPWEAEAVGTADLLCSALEAVLVVLLVLMVRRLDLRESAALTKVQLRMIVVGAVAAAAVTVAALAAHPPVFGHRHHPHNLRGAGPRLPPPPGEPARSPSTAGTPLLASRVCRDRARPRSPDRGRPSPAPANGPRR